MYANITNCKESLVFMIKLKKEELVNFQKEAIYDYLIASEIDTPQSLVDWIYDIYSKNQRKNGKILVEITDQAMKNLLEKYGYKTKIAFLKKLGFSIEDTPKYFLLKHSYFDMLF